MHKTEYPYGRKRKPTSALQSVLQLVGCGLLVVFGFVMLLNAVVQALWMKLH